MSALAALLGYPATADAIEAVAGRGGLRRALIGLRSRRLLATSQGGGQPAIPPARTWCVDFYYTICSAEMSAVRLHCRAGEYYEAEEPDVPESCPHFERAAKYERAARLGHGRRSGRSSTRARPERCGNCWPNSPARQLPAEQWIAVNIARGDTHAFLGEGDLARSSYQEAFSRLEALPDSPKRAGSEPVPATGWHATGKASPRTKRWTGLRRGQV